MSHAHEISHSTQDPQRFSLRLGDRGRLVLPVLLRKRLGLEPGDRLVLILEPDQTMRLVSLRTQVKRLRGMLASHAPERSLVDELIQERREEATRE